VKYKRRNKTFTDAHHYLCMTASSLHCFFEENEISQQQNKEIKSINKEVALQF
jgi:hypothetical protein